jgi:hypothetical protein
LPELSDDETDKSATILHRTKEDVIPVLNMVKGSYYVFLNLRPPDAGYDCINLLMGKELTRENHTFTSRNHNHG